MNYSEMFARITGAAVLAAGLAGCGTVHSPFSPGVNTTNNTPAVSDPVVKISRCAENGFDVVQANQFNGSNQFRPSPRYRHNDVLGIFNSHQPNELINTARGSLLIIPGNRPIWESRQNYTMKLAWCRSDLTALNGGAALGAEPNGSRGPIGNPGPRPSGN